MDFNLGSIADTIGGFLEQNYLPIVLGTQALATWQRNQAAKEVQRRQQAMVDAENARAATLAAEANQAFQQGLAGFTPAAQNAQMANLSDVYARRMEPQASAITEAEYTSGRAPAAVRESAQRVVDEGKAKAKRYATTGSNLAGAAGIGFENQVALQRTGEKVAMPNSFAATSRSLMPTEVQAAVLQGQKNRTAADILDGGASLALLYGITGGRRAPKPAGVQDGGGYKSVFNDLR